VHSVQDCVDEGCGNLGGLGDSNDMSNDSIDEIRWAQKLNVQSTEELSSGKSNFKLERIMKALKASEELQRQVAARIKEIQGSEDAFEKKVVGHNHRMSKRNRAPANILNQRCELYTTPRGSTLQARCDV
jgi:hypothetical protein